MEDDAHAWIIDSGATNHICSSLQTLSSSTPLRDGDVSMRLGSGEVVSAVGLKKLFCAPNQIGKTKLAEALVPGSF